MLGVPFKHHWVCLFKDTLFALFGRLEKETHRKTEAILRVPRLLLLKGKSKEIRALLGP